jgi:hypothetical protein
MSAPKTTQPNITRTNHLRDIALLLQAKPIRAAEFVRRDQRFAVIRAYGGAAFYIRVL